MNETRASGIGAEERLLHRLRTLWRGESEVRVGSGRGNTATGGALQEAELQEERLVDVLDRVALFVGRGGDRIEADRPAAELVDHRLEQPPVGGVQAQFVHFQ